MAVPLSSRAEPIPGYKLLERLGRGGFGEVWKCEAPGGIHKAIKFVYGDLDTAGDDGKPAEQEFKALARVKQVRHPFILSLERFDVIEGQLVIVMELADRNLWDRFRESRNQGFPGIPREELLRYMEEAAEALDLMNSEYKLQHLDIKPQNLFLVHNHVKVADFGLVKDFEGMSATVTGGVTPVYAAPETFDGRVTRHCDQYSLAIVYQELLTGVRPFNGSNARQLVLQHMSQEPDLSPLPESDRAAIGQALAKKSDERFPTTTALVQALVRSGRARPDSVIIPPTTPSRQTPTPSPMHTQTLRKSLPPPPAPLPAHGPAPNAARPQPLRPPTPAPRPPTPPGHPPRATVSPPAATPVRTMQRPAEASILIGPQTQGDRSTAPPEQTGDGVLRPALIVSAGHVGGLVLRRIRSAMLERFGTLDAAPHVRMMAVETDLDAARELTQGRAALDSKEIYLAELRRPSHYLQSGLSVDRWMDTQIVYRIPRNPATMGLRSLGRLAFCDHARDLRQRLRTTLEAACEPAALTHADNKTKLGLRTNRPVVYVVVNVGGGTGGGMFLEMAYVARSLMRQLGYSQPEVVGVLLLPCADRASIRAHGLANAYASLIELLHFSAPDTTYQLNLGTRDRSISDRDPPFDRCMFMQLPHNPDNPVRNQIIGLSAGLVVRDLFTQIGRNAADARKTALEKLTPTARAASAAVLATAGATWLSWPRRRLVRRAAARIGEQLLRQWTGKEADHLFEPIQGWLDEQWDRLLRPDHVVERVHAACAEALGSTPDAKFEACIGPLSDVAQTPKATSEMDAHSACRVLNEVFGVVGKPVLIGADEGPPGLMEQILTETAQAFGAEYEGQLAEMSVHFVEQPQYRLPGAEETVRQLTERLKQVVDTYEELKRTLNREADELYVRLFPLIGSIDSYSAGSRKASMISEASDVAQAYAKKRYQLLVARCVLSIYRGMLNLTPEYLRDINFCRQRLLDVVEVLSQSADSPEVEGLGPGQELFPGGDPSPDEAAARLIQGMTLEDWVEFDNKVQNQVRKQFEGVITMCLGGPNAAEPLAALLRQQATEFLDPRLGRQDSAAVFFQHHSDDRGAQRAIAGSFDEAAPILASTPKAGHGVEIAVMALPAGPNGDRFRRLALDALPDENIVPTVSPDDIVIYREKPALTSADLPHLTSLGREAADHAVKEQLPPHARFDVTWRGAK
jgi:serine/threonine protein kinase